MRTSCDESLGHESEGNRYIPRALLHELAQRLRFGALRAAGETAGGWP